MAISKKQTEQLLSLVANAKPDSMDCDGCFEHLAEFAEAELAGKEIPEALRCVEKHIEQCACCQEEHNALLEGLRGLQEGDPER